MTLNRRLQQQALLNKKLQRLLDSSIQQTEAIKTTAEEAIKPAALSSGLASKADLVHTHTLSNLTQSGATLNQVPQWSGSAWVPATVSGGSAPSNVDGGNASSIPVVGLAYDGGSA
jgi:hypothetical protein